MKHVHKSVLLWYAPHEMYRLVVDIDAYPRFLPWCAAAQVLQTHPDGVTARLTLAYRGVRQAFTTRNVHTPDAGVEMKLVDGPFSRLHGRWVFSAIGRPGDESRGCKVEFDLRYAFANAPLEGVVSPVFDKIADTLVDSFVQRAEEVYGAR